MSMVAKTGKNLAANLPVSNAPVSIRTIIKDLQHLEKNLTTKNELEAMKAKIKNLEDENSRIKIELQATEADRKLYYNQFHHNVKELNEMKADNEVLKTEIASLKYFEKSNIEEIASSSFQSAIPVNDSRSDDDDEEPVPGTAPQLAIEGGNDTQESTGPSVLEQLVHTGSKRPLAHDSQAEPDKKKAKTHAIQLIQMWKCTIAPCTENRFTLIQDLRTHIVDSHPKRKYLCNRCPFSTAYEKSLKEHEQSHVVNELNWNGIEGAQKCGLCNVFFLKGGLTRHNKMFH